MRRLPVISTMKRSRLSRRLETCGFSVVRRAEPGDTGAVLVEAEHGSAIAECLRGWRLPPSRTVAVCRDPRGLPPGCLWLSPKLLDQPKGPSLLRTWLSDSDADPVQSLLAQISHDMRAPLSVISTAASLLARFGQKENHKTTRYLELINESSGVLKSLVNDILDYSKIREGEFSFVPREFHLPQLLESLTESFRLLLGETSGVRLSCRYDDSCDYVYGDPGRLRQVLTNLLNNAAKFTSQGRIELLARRRGEKLEFSVRDTGIGISESAREKIFQPYQQAEESIHARYGGTGLGLTICKILVEHMNGRIDVRSELGTGSVFTFTADLPPRFSPNTQTVPQLTGRNLLVHSANAGLYFSSLGRTNSIDSCRTRADLAQKLSHGKPDLIIVDLDTDGLSLESDIPNLLACARRACPVVVLTSAGQRGDVALCTEAGVKGYLTLPLEPHELEVCLSLALNASEGEVITKYSAKELLAAA